MSTITESASDKMRAWRLSTLIFGFASVTITQGLSTTSGCAVHETFHGLYRAIHSKHDFKSTSIEARGTRLGYCCWLFPEFEAFEDKYKGLPYHVVIVSNEKHLPQSINIPKASKRPQQFKNLNTPPILIKKYPKLLPSRCILPSSPSSPWLQPPSPRPRPKSLHAHAPTKQPNIYLLARKVKLFSAPATRTSALQAKQIPLMKRPPRRMRRLAVGRGRHQVV